MLMFCLEDWGSLSPLSTPLMITDIFVAKIVSLICCAVDILCDFCLSFTVLPVSSLKIALVDFS